MKREINCFTKYYYGMKCKLCCGFYPRLCVTDGFDSKCYYVCEECNKRTGLFSMPWLAEKAWNNDEVFCTGRQISLFDNEV